MMPPENLIRAEIAAHKGDGPSPVVVAHIAYPHGRVIGKGGRPVISKENATRFTVPMRIECAADAAGVSVKSHRTSHQTFVSMLVEAGAVP